MKNCIALVLLITGFANRGTAQDTPAFLHPGPGELQAINQTDSIGRKQGFWVENDSEIYYKDGRQYGVAKWYHHEADGGKMYSFHEYKEGNDDGSWYYFDRGGHLLSIVIEQGENKNLRVKRDDGIMLKPKYKCYMKRFNTDGSILEEGIALYDESVEIDFFKYGKWETHSNNKGLNTRQLSN